MKEVITIPSPELLKNLEDIVTWFYHNIIHESYDEMQTLESGYHGLKRLHRYSSKERLHHFYKFTDFLISKLEIIPIFALSFTPDDHPTLLEALQHSVKKESDLLDLINATTEMARSYDIALYGKLICLADYTRCNKAKYEKVLKKWSNTGNDKIFMQTYDEILHHKYEQKEKEKKY